MTLNNQINRLKTESDQIEDKKSKLKNAEQETSSKQLSKITQLSRILMAIDNLEEFCQNRKRAAQAIHNLQPGQIINATKNITGLNYNAINMQQPDKKQKFQQIKTNHFDNYNDRKELAIQQLTVIGQYLNDFTAIIEDFDKGEKTVHTSQVPQKTSGVNVNAVQEQQEENAKLE